MPSVTNDVSLATASRPERHGISSNYRLLPAGRGRLHGDRIYPGRDDVPARAPDGRAPSSPPRRTSCAPLDGPPWPSLPSAPIAGVGSSDPEYLDACGHTPQPVAPRRRSRRPTGFLKIGTGHDALGQGPTNVYLHSLHPTTETDGVRASREEASARHRELHRERHRRLSRHRRTGRRLRDTGEGVYMETYEYILAETMFQRAPPDGTRLHPLHYLRLP